jgi:hypothetical protein
VTRALVDLAPFRLYGVLLPLDVAQCAEDWQTVFERHTDRAVIRLRTEKLVPAGGDR